MVLCSLNHYFENIAAATVSWSILRHFLPLFLSCQSWTRLLIKSKEPSQRKSIFLVSHFCYSLGRLEGDASSLSQPQMKMKMASSKIKAPSYSTHLREINSLKNILPHSGLLHCLLFLLFWRSFHFPARTSRYGLQHLFFDLSILCLPGCIPATNLARSDSHSATVPPPDQVSQLQGKTGIDHLDEFNLPAATATTRSTGDPPAVERLADQQSEPTDKYMVFATDGKNQEQTNQTEQYLQNLVGKENVRPPFIFDDEIRYWLCISKYFMSLFPLWDSKMTERP